MIVGFACLSAWGSGHLNAWQLARLIIRDILRDKMDLFSKTINRKQLAQLVGVSPAVVTTVMQNRPSTVAVSAETRERVLRLAQKHNYKPDISGTSLVSGRTFLIGVLFAEQMGHVMWETIKGLESTAAEKDYALLVFPVPPSLEEETIRLRRAMSRKVSAIACVPILDEKSRSNTKTYRTIHKSGIPIVQLYGDHMEGIPSVGIDEVLAAKTATEYLIKRGHKKIIHFTRNDSQDLICPNRFISAKRRREGYLQAMALANLKPIILEVSGDGDELTVNCRSAAHDVLHHREAPTAAFCYSDARAISLMNGLHDLGVSIPKEFSVIGFDNSSISTLSYPALTSLEVDRNEIGHKACEILLSSLSGMPAENHYVSAKVYERESVSRLKLPR